MKIEDFGFIIFIKKYEENSLLLKVLSKENGFISGYTKHINKNRNSFQIGSFVKFNWSAKNVSQLGSINIEVIKSNLSCFMDSRFHLHIMESITLMINDVLYERYLENDLYYRLENILCLISKCEKKEIIMKEYLLFENSLLNVVGSGIIFDNAVSFDELYYISPKTGLAVSKPKGDPFRDKLLLFPSIFKKDFIEKNDILNCFNVMDFFFKKYFNDSNYSQKYKNISLSRQNVINNI